MLSLSYRQIVFANSIDYWTIGLSHYRTNPIEIIIFVTAGIPRGQHFWSNAQHSTSVLEWPAYKPNSNHIPYSNRNPTNSTLLGRTLFERLTKSLYHTGKYAKYCDGYVCLSVHLYVAAKLHQIFCAC